MSKRTFLIFFVSFIILSTIFAVPYSSAIKPKYFPLHRKIRDITDFMWPVKLTANSEIKINVSNTGGFITFSYVIPPGFISIMYFKNSTTGNYYYKENLSGSGGGGGALHGYIKSKGACIIGLSGVGELRIMYFLQENSIDDIASSENITNLFFQLPMSVPNPAYFRFETPPDVCVYGFTVDHMLTGINESKSLTKDVIIDEGDVSGIEIAFFVFYNRSGGPVHDVKLIDYGPYHRVKNLPAVYGLIPLSLILIAVGVTWYWIRKK